MGEPRGDRATGGRRVGENGGEGAAIAAPSDEPTESGGEDGDSASGGVQLGGVAGRGRVMIEMDRGADYGV